MEHVECTCNDPGKHKTFVGPTSKTLGRRCTNVIQRFCVCWDVNYESRANAIIRLMVVHSVARAGALG